MIDLACGTGAATLIFAAAGIDVTGVDSSEQMLRVARCASESADIPVRWQHADMRCFDVKRRVDLVTCFYDGMNYVHELTEMAEVFSSVRRALRPDGLFIFDLNTRQKFAANWNETCYVAVDREDIFGLYQSWYQPETGLSPLILTFFVRDKAGKWERFEEEHIERAYPLDHIYSLLTDGGFEVDAMLDYPDRCPQFGPPGSEQSHRVVFIAKRAEMAKSST
jgi:SAM-dependent methyltransferase